MEHWYVTGLQQQGDVPSLIASVGESASSLLSFVFEVNPEESAADQLLRIHSQPVEIIYDAVNTNRFHFIFNFQFQFIHLPEQKINPVCPPADCEQFG